MPFDVPCFVINMKRSQDRRARIVADFQRLGIPFEFIEAVDGSALDATEIKKFTRNGYSRSLGVKIPLGYIGSSLSHHKALETIVQRGHDVAIVFEDDAVPAPDFCSRVSIALTGLPQLGMLKLCGSKIISPQLERTVFRFGESRVVQLVSPTLVYCSYAVSNRAARKLIPRLVPIVDMVDMEIARVWAHGVEVYELLPYAVQTSGASSTIGEKNNKVFDSPPFWDREKSFRRTLRRLPFRVERSIGIRMSRARLFGWRAVMWQRQESKTI
jgi:glycosyl transferase, family 25